VSLLSLSLQPILRKSCQAWSESAVKSCFWEWYSKAGWVLTSLLLLYAARNSQTSGYEVFCNRMFLIQAHHVCACKEHLLYPSHDLTRLLHFVECPYYNLHSKHTHTFLSRNTQCFLTCSMHIPIQTTYAYNAHHSDDLRTPYPLTIQPTCIIPLA